MTTALETIPVDEEGATLLHKQPRSTGIRRVVLGAALASFVIGVLAATAVRTSPGRHASNLHSKHKYETTEVDDEGPHKYYWDDDVPTQRRNTSRPGVAPDSPAINLISSHNQQLYYGDKGDDWNIGRGGCGSARLVGMYSVGSNSGDLGLARLWKEFSDGKWVDSPTLSVSCVTTPA